MAKLILSENGTIIEYFPLGEEGLVVGRAHDCEVRLEHRGVSGHHAKFYWDGSQVFIEDMASTNGTQVNNSLIKRQELKTGDQITIGIYRIEFLNDAEAEDNFEKTIVLRPGQRLPTAGKLPVPPQEAAAAAAVLPPPNASLRILSGRQAGQEVSLIKAVTTVGKPGVQVIAIYRQPNGYTIAYVPTDGDQGLAPKINGKLISKEPQRLRDNDVIELGGVNLGFFCEDVVTAGVSI